MEYTDCAICLEKNSNNVYKCSTCENYFHIVCIERWLDTNNTCPICRDNLIEEPQHDIFLERIEGENNRYLYMSCICNILLYIIIITIFSVVVYLKTKEHN